MFKEPGLISLLSTKEHENAERHRLVPTGADKAEGDLGLNCSCFVSPAASAVTSKACWDACPGLPAPASTSWFICPDWG